MEGFKFQASPESVLRLIEGGESDHVEFKAAIPTDEIAARNLTAFANTGGGVLLVGVGDGKEILGIPQQSVGRTVERLRRISRTLFSWPTLVGEVQVDGKPLVFAAVERAPEEYRPIATATGEIFHRLGDLNVPFTLSVPWRFSGGVEVTSREGEEAEAPRSGGQVILFVAMSFHFEEEPALVDYFNAILRAVEKTGLPITVSRIDLMEGDFEISQEIMNEIDRADLVLADLTLSSRNVYFELGYARGKGKRILQTARAKTPLEFDLRNWKTLFYKNATELEAALVQPLESAHAAVLAAPGIGP